jgi:predicted ATPase
MEAAAALTERILRRRRQVHILATSREALRVEGEHVYRLEPLAFPSEDAEADGVGGPCLSSGAAVCRAGGRQAAPALISTTPTRRNRGNICRRLDGVALAIELAAGRVGTYGLPQTAALLEERLSLLWLGQRTAPPRQQTLKATLDWSYGLLSDLERLVLRQLAIFIGSFTLEAARGRAGSTRPTSSLSSAPSTALSPSPWSSARACERQCVIVCWTRHGPTPSGSAPTRAERVELAGRHANYYRRWLEQTGADWPTLSSAAERALHLGDLANVRSALDWCFGPHGDIEIGIGLAAAAAPVFWVKSLRGECHRWSERAIARWTT